VHLGSAVQSPTWRFPHGGCDVNTYQRIACYLAQTGRGQLTSRQDRRARHKMNRANRRPVRTEADPA
jgi:hypothetical protein